MVSSPCLTPSLRHLGEVDFVLCPVSRVQSKSHLLLTHPSRLIPLTWAFSPSRLASQPSVSYTTAAVRCLAQVLREILHTFMITERRVGHVHPTQGDYFRLLRHAVTGNSQETIVVNLEPFDVAQ